MTLKAMSAGGQKDERARAQQQVDKVAVGRHDAAARAHAIPREARSRVAGPAAFYF